jgi:hypothetical protein
MRLSAKMVVCATALLLGAAGPVYTASGDLVAPAQYRTWIFLSSGLNMSYNDNAATAGHAMFNNVFVDPDSWRAFTSSGHWPDKTMFALEVRGASSRGSINKHGQYQTEDLMGVEFHIRDEARFKGGWAFFSWDIANPVVGVAKPAKFLAYTQACYACHQAHGAVDTSFTQFYPTAKPIAKKAGTYHER